MVLRNLQNRIVVFSDRMKCKSSVVNIQSGIETHIRHELQIFNDGGSWTTVGVWEKEMNSVFCTFESGFDVIVHGQYSLKTEVKTYLNKHCETEIRYSNIAWC